MTSEISCDQQAARIIAKLSEARDADPDLRAFGARYHRYELGPPLTETTVADVEAKHGIVLPPDFKTFLTQVGHGGSKGEGAAAGPFYGIWRLSEVLHGFGGIEAVGSAPQVRSTMTEAEWRDAVASLDEDNPALSDVENDARSDTAFAALLGGMLKLGHQGCDSYQALIVSGPEAGRVVNIDTELRMPKFAPDRTFLDWYERWLDHVLDGTAQTQGDTWFGHEGS